MAGAQRNRYADENYVIRRPTYVAVSDFVTPKRFAMLIGKSHQAVKDMAKAEKLPLVAAKNPDVAKPQPEHYVDLVAWNEGMRLARDTLPKEIRDGWLRWIGLNV
jgi:hypothetical protein